MTYRYTIELHRLRELIDYLKSEEGQDKDLMMADKYVVLRNDFLAQCDTIHTDIYGSALIELTKK